MKLFGALAALTLVAAACSSESESAADVCAADAFGCVVYQQGESIKLGTLLAISGNVAFLGDDSTEGIKIAMDRLDGTIDGTAGQVLGRTVELVNEDDLCSKEGGQTGATKLAADTQIVAVIGTTCSSAALGVADKILSDKGVVLISPSNTNPNLTDANAHQPFYARTAHNDKIQGAIVAEFAFNELGAKTAATINDESPYADALAAVFRSNFEALGGTTVDGGVEAIQSTDTDFKPLLTRIAEGKPDVLYFPNFNPACALIAKQAKGIAGLADTKLIGSDGCLDPTYLSTGGSDVDGSYASGPDFSTLEERNTFYRDSFLPQYEKDTGGKPTAAFHAHAFDAAEILFQAIAKVAIEEDGVLSIPRSALRDAVLGTSNFEGLTGTINCDSSGDCAGDVTIALYEAPNWPVEGGTGDGASVYSDTKSLADVS